MAASSLKSPSDADVSVRARSSSFASSGVGRMSVAPCSVVMNITRRSPRAVLANENRSSPHRFLQIMNSSYARERERERVDDERRRTTVATKEEIEYCAGPFLTVFDTVLRAREAHLKQAL